MNQTSSHHLACPKCQSDQIMSHGKRYALYPAGCLSVLTLPIALVHRESTPHEFECRACEHRFAIRTPAAKMALAGLWIMLALLVVWIVVNAMGKGT